MAKAKIIDSYSLECLISGILCEIEQADSQKNAYQDELLRERQHKQNNETIGRLENQINDWSLRRDVLHQCLCKIKMQIKEIEI